MRRFMYNQAWKCLEMQEKDEFYMGNKMTTQCISTDQWMVTIQHLEWVDAKVKMNPH